MTTRTVLAGAALALCLPLLTSAATLQELQAQLAQLMAQLSALQQGSTRMQSTTQQLTQGATEATTQASASVHCPNLTRNLFRGMRGSDVTALQTFLIAQGHLAAGNNTGFYGALTEAAVKQFQCKHLRICSGSASSNGYGAVGPKTRTAIAKTCSTSSTSQGTSISGITSNYAQRGYGSENTYSQGGYTSQSTQSSTQTSNQTSGQTTSQTSSQSSSQTSASQSSLQTSTAQTSYAQGSYTTQTSSGTTQASTGSSGQSVSVPSVMVGFWSIGNINVAGDYIANTAAESNVAVIPLDETGSFIPRIQKAQAQGLQVVLMVRESLFQSDGGILHSDYENRFRTMWNSLGSYQNSVVGFYLIDEPYLNNAGASGAQKISEALLKQNLTNAITAVKSIAPQRPVMFTESTLHVMRGDFDSLIPSNLDYVGVNCYLYLGSGTGCSEEKVISSMQMLASALQTHQKMIVTADGYVLDIPAGYSSFTDEVLRSRIIFWQHLLAPYFASGKVGALTPFIYQSVGDSISGLNEFPKSYAEMKRYMLSAKTGSPTVQSTKELQTTASISVSGTYDAYTSQNVRDNDTSTAWNAGGYAPQWIQFGLGEAYRIARLSLSVGQSPAGKTMHQVYVSQNGSSWALLQTFSGVTETGQTLEYAPTNPASGVRYIKIETTESPSWVGWNEIKIEGY